MKGEKEKRKKKSGNILKVEGKTDERSRKKGKKQKS